MTAKRLSRVIWAVLALAAGSTWAATNSIRVRAWAPQDRARIAVMKDLSTAFSALDQELRAGDSPACLRTIDGLETSRDRMADLHPQVHAELRDEFDRHVARLGALLGEMRDEVTRSQLPGAAQALDELRATCVSCHIKFRADNVERGNFPARDNTISGAVVLCDADGEVKTDRSWVLVFLEAGKDAAPYVWQRGTVRMAQRLRRFEPRVLPIVAGTTVEFPNDDTIFHNVFSLSKTARFDLGTYEPGRTASVSLDRTGLVKVYCNIHPDMSASIVVLANPWFTLTDREGRFVIANVPAGEYTLRAWNDHGAEVRQPLSIPAGTDAIVDAALELREKLRVLEHDNKFGKAYPEKY